jgi:hypothetical protein
MPLSALRVTEQRSITMLAMSCGFLRPRLPRLRAYGQGTQQRYESGNGKMPAQTWSGGHGAPLAHPGNSVCAQLVAHVNESEDPVFRHIPCPAQHG